MHVRYRVVKERVKVIGLSLGSTRLVHADVLKQVNNRVFGHVKCLSEVLLLSNEFDWVLLKQLNVSLRHHHDRNHSLVKDVFHVWPQSRHGALDFCCLRNKLDHKV